MIFKFLLLLSLTTPALASVETCSMLFSPSFDRDEMSFEYYGGRLTGFYHFMIMPDFTIKLFAANPGRVEIDSSVVYLDGGKIVHLQASQNQKDHFLRALAKLGGE